MTAVHIATASAPPEVLAVAAGPAAPALDAIPTLVLPLALRATVEAFLAEAETPPKPGEVRELPLPGSMPARVLVAGIGAGTASDLRAAAAAVARATTSNRLGVAMPGLGGAELAALTEGFVLGGYRFTGRSGTPSRLADVDLFGVDDADAVERGVAYARGATWARDLANARTSTKTPHWVVEQAAHELRPLGVAVIARDATWLAAQGFGGVLAVGSSSASPPLLVEAGWRPRGATAAPHLVLVGKGITFDTGGYNLKPGESMKTMHTDIAGGAAALGALRTIATLRLPVRVSVLVPLAENSVSGAAMRPGDVLRHYGGRTTEVTNTDAEGRLVLADAMAYAVARMRPSALVDIATLTGGIKISLGLGTAGLFATSDELAAQLAGAAEDTGEAVWRMPIPDEYEHMLDSEVADAVNSAANPSGIAGAVFLRPFAGDVPWAHLDIAGPARAGSDAGVNSRGATGFGARLLARWVESSAR